MQLCLSAVVHKTRLFARVRHQPIEKWANPSCFCWWVRALFIRRKYKKQKQNEYIYLYICCVCADTALQVKGHVTHAERRRARSLLQGGCFLLTNSTPHIKLAFIFICSCHRRLFRLGMWRDPTWRVLLDAFLAPNKCSRSLLLLLRSVTSDLNFIFISKQLQWAERKLALSFGSNYSRVYDCFILVQLYLPGRG